VDSAYVFLEKPAEPVRRRFEAVDLEGARDGIERLLEKLAAARFEVTVHPHRDLCLDCPARERLCSHRTAEQLRDSPEPAVEPRGQQANSGAPGPPEPQLTLLEGS